MGKGSNTTTTNQTQTYQPNQTAANAITGALGQAQSAASLPFNIPQAPVAGFSQDQQNAFGLVNNAQGQAQPYYNQASNLFNQSAQTPDISQFFNPYASAVTSQLNNIFGQQTSQNTGQLTQAAGGVGADRIAVGQGNLANQQGLAAGQTLSQLYGQSLSAAQQQQNLEQGAAYGQASVGSASQNAALSGANALLGTGGLQQQLSQAQLNSPYQQQLAQAAFPYQQSQFLTSAVGALAPGLGGTTNGTGTTTGPSPSLLSQILGLGTAGVGAAGGAGAFNTSGKGSASPWNSQSGYASGQLAANAASPYYGPGFDTGGAVHPYRIIRPYPVVPKPAGNDNTAPMFSGRGPAGANDNGEKYDDGGSVSTSPFNLPSGISDKPINVDAQSIIPEGKTASIQPHVPQLNLNPPSQSQGNNGSAAGDVAKIAQMAMMFMQRGGSVNPYAEGGYADGGASDADDNDPTPASFDERFPYRMPAPEATDKWRKETDAPLSFAGNEPPSAAGRAISAATRGAPNRAAASDDGDVLPANAAPTAGQGNPYAATSDGAPAKQQSFVDSPWAALMAAGLGIAGGTSPFAAVNIGQGGLQGLKALEAQKAAGQKDESIRQSAKRLELEAKHHEDQFTRMTMGQKQAAEQADRPYKDLTAYQKSQIDAQKQRDERAEKQFNRPYEELTAAQQQAVERQKEQDDLAERRFNRPYQELTLQEKAQLEESKRQHDLARVPQGYRANAEGNLEPVPGGPHSTDQIRAEAEAKRLPAMADEDLRPMIDTYKAGNTSGVLTSISRGAQGAANVQRFWHLLAEDLVKEGASGKDLAAAKANFMAQSAGARTAAVREANIDTAVNEAKGTFPEVLRTSAALPRSDWTPVNAALEFYRQKSGSPEQRQFGAAIQAAVTAYSQAMSRTGANSVYAQQHAAEILSHTDGPEALKASIDQLNTEMAIAKAAPEETRQGILNRILGVKEPAATGATPPAAGATAPALPDAAKAQLKEGQVTTFGNGQKWTLKNGQPAQVP